MLYYHSTGTIYFSEVGEWQTGDAGPLVLRLPAAKTLIISEISDTGFKCKKLSGAFGKPEYFDLPYTSVVAIQKIKDNVLLTKLRAELSDIILASGIN